MHQPIPPWVSDASAIRGKTHGEKRPNHPPKSPVAVQPRRGMCRDLVRRLGCLGCADLYGRKGGESHPVFTVPA